MHFQILGPLRVLDGDDRDVALGGARPAAILAMLLVRPGEVVSSDRLIEDLWDGAPPPTAAKTLQVHISRLRRALSGAGNGNGAAAGPLVTRAAGYVLELDPDRIDAFRFERLVAEGCAALGEGAHSRASARLRSALALWRGDALSDFAYASFAQDPIARLDGLRSVALESAIEAELALGRHAELVPELKALIKRHPLSERLRALLMRALYRAGRQAEALGVYHQTRRVLVDQLGIEPSAELRELERAILAQDDSLAPPPPAPPARPRPEAHRSGLLVGYGQELASLEDALEQALTGRGRIALVSGEPGVGKTRLTDELAAVARLRGARVVSGRCWEGGGEPPYWPWIQTLRGLTADRDPATLRAQLGHNAAELVQLLPELQDVVPGVSAETVADSASAETIADSEETRFRLFDATAAFVRRTARDEPLVVVLDDLHAADQASVALLGFLAGAALDAPVLLVGTYRDTELTPGDALSSALDQMTRASDCLQLVLTGLSGEDTAHFVELTAGVAPMRVLSAAIHGATGGNPLFVVELVRLLEAEGRLREIEATDELTLPRGIDQVIGRRLQRLPERVRGVLAIAAVIGRDFDVPVLDRVSDEHGADLLELLAEAVAAGVVEEHPGGFRFSHELVRQILYAGLTAPERGRLHATVASAIEELRGAAATPSELAHHYAHALPAGDPDRAIHYLSLAGDAAADVSANFEAAAAYERALRIGKERGAAAELLASLAVRAAEQLVVIPEANRARALADEAAIQLASSPDRITEARLAVVRAHLDIFDACVADRVDIEAVIAMFQELGDPFGEARAWWALSTWHFGRSRGDDSLAAAEQTLACARRAASQGLIAQGLRGVVAALAHGSTPVGEALARVRALEADAPDAMARARVRAAVAELEAMRGHFSEARALMDGAHRLLPPNALEDFVCTQGGTAIRIERLADNPRATEELVRATCARNQSQGLLTFLATDLTYLVDALTAQGRLQDAAAELARAVAIVRDDDPDALFRQARSRGRLELARGELAAAEASMRTALGHLDDTQSVDERAETLIGLARVLFAAGRDDEAREIAQTALELSEAREHAVHAARARELLGAAEAVPAS